MRIYCQYTIGGFKIFQLNAFPHTEGKDRYVKISEIAEARGATEQDIFVTGKCDCRLDLRVMRCFSQRSVRALMLHDCGMNRDESLLFLDDLDSQTAYAFSADTDEEREALSKLAARWVNDDDKSLVTRLNQLVEVTFIGDTQVFVFHEGLWKELLSTLSDARLDNRVFAKVARGDKNLLVNLVRNKRKILESLGIDTPLQSFVSIPGNEDVRIAERNTRIKVYAVAALTALAVGGMIYYRCKS